MCSRSSCGRTERRRKRRKKPNKVGVSPTFWDHTFSDRRGRFGTSECQAPASLYWPPLSLLLLLPWDCLGSGAWHNSEQRKWWMSSLSLIFSILPLLESKLEGSSWSTVCPSLGARSWVSGQRFWREQKEKLSIGLVILPVLVFFPNLPVVIYFSVFSNSCSTYLSRFYSCVAQEGDSLSDCHFF